MFKKFHLSLITLLVLLMPICYAYTDTENHWANEAISSLSKIDIIQGYGDDTFRPDDYITRAELTTIINRLLKNEKESTKFIPDNNSKDWYYSEIRKAVESGVMRGDADGYVRPDDYITREEAVVMLHRAFVCTTTENIRINTYADAKDVSAWAYDAMAMFVRNEYIRGDEGNVLRPKDNVTRAELVTMITRLFSEIIVKGECTGTIYGNLLLNGKGIRVHNVVVEGDLIIAEGSEGNMNLKSIIVNGNLIIRTPTTLPTRNFEVKGDIIKVYEKEENNEPKEYSNSTYGIYFTIPEDATVIEALDDKQKINYRLDNLMVIRFRKDEELHFQSFTAIEREETNKYDNIYNKIAEKEIGTAKCGYYFDGKESHLIVIKRDDIVYTILLYNIENDNVIDNILNSIKLTDGELVHPHKELTYRNTKLCLKFQYLDYIGVDDSYNTGIVFDGESYFMLFIQVNSITDLEKYSVEQLKVLFESLAKSEGEVISSKSRKVYQYDALEYLIRDGEKLSRNLYIVVGNRLYKLIFTGEASRVESIGNELFDKVINSIEM